MKADIVNDLSNLTTIDSLYIGKLLEKVVWCISDNLEECIYKEDNQLEIDLKFGIICITLEDNQVKYKFRPSEYLEQTIVNTVVNEKSLLEKQMEKNLVSKIQNVYKDLL